MMCLYRRTLKKELSLHLGCQIDLGCQSLVPSWWWSYIWICHLMWHFFNISLVHKSFLIIHICMGTSFAQLTHVTCWLRYYQAKPIQLPCTGAGLTQAKLLITRSSPPTHHALALTLSWRKPSCWLPGQAHPTTTQWQQASSWGE